MSWLLPDEFHAKALAVRAQVLGGGACATMFWRNEIANALLMAARRKRYDPVRMSADLAALALLPVVMDAETWRAAWGDAVGLARAHKLTSYDAAYLELARRSGLPLATFDSDLAKAALAEGVSVV